MKINPPVPPRTRANGQTLSGTYHTYKEKSPMTSLDTPSPSRTARCCRTV